MGLGLEIHNKAGQVFSATDPKIRPMPIAQEGIPGRLKTEMATKASLGQAGTDFLQAKAKCRRNVQKQGTILDSSEANSNQAAISATTSMIIRIRVSNQMEGDSLPKIPPEEGRLTITLQDSFNLQASSVKIKTSRQTISRNSIL